jgi:hypothetical protein
VYHTLIITRQPNNIWWLKERGKRGSWRRRKFIQASANPNWRSAWYASKAKACAHLFLQPFPIKNYVCGYLKWNIICVCVCDMLSLSHSLGFVSVGDDWIYDLRCRRHIIPTDAVPCHIYWINIANKDGTRLWWNHNTGNLWFGCILNLL